MNRKNIAETSRFYANIIVYEADKKNNTYEDSNLYHTAFLALLKNGCPYKINSVAAKSTALTTTQDDKTKTSKKNQNQKQNEETVEIKKNMENIVVITIGKTAYTCYEKDLISRFGNEYSNIVYKKKAEKKPVASLDTNNDFETLPYVDFSEKEAEKQIELKAKKPEKTVVRKKMPIIENDRNYPDDETGRKDYDTFLFNQHTIKVRLSGEEYNYTAVIYPLTMNTEDTVSADIFVVVFDSNGGIRSAMSDYTDNKVKSVITEFKECSLVFRGEWKDGEFLTSAGLYSTEDNFSSGTLSDNAIPIRPSRRTSSFYFRLFAESGEVLNVFPTSLLKNDKITGMAKVVIMIENGETRRTFTVDTTAPNLLFNGSNKKILPYWAGNSLRVDIEDGFNVF